MQAQVAIVEDNPITVRSLLKTIDWASLGCEIVGTAMDGVSGRELLLNTRPDILLTDIRMPEEDGLDMLESVREELPDMKVIIITGYDHFQYASRAIKLSVFDYILKPIQNEEVIRTVRRALDIMRKQQEKDAAISQVDVFRTKAQLLSLLTNDSHAGQDVGLMLEEAKLRAPAYYLMIIQPDGAHTPEMSFMDEVAFCMKDCIISLFFNSAFWLRAALIKESTIAPHLTVSSLAFLIPVRPPFLSVSSSMFVELSSFMMSAVFMFCSI